VVQNLSRGVCIGFGLDGSVDGRFSVYCFGLIG
jgi:hypothetical protein